MASSSRSNIRGSSSHSSGSENVTSTDQNAELSFGTADKYQVSQMTIPPFRGGRRGRDGADSGNIDAAGDNKPDSSVLLRTVTSSLTRNDLSKGSWRGSLLQKQNVDFDPPLEDDLSSYNQEGDSSSSSSDYDYASNDNHDEIDTSNKSYESYDSSGNSSSVGVQSNFIKGLIQKQKKRGNWNSSIASVDDHSATVLDRGIKERRNRGTMRRVYSHNSLASMDTNQSHPSMVRITSFGKGGQALAANNHSQTTKPSLDDNTMVGGISEESNRGTLVKPTAQEISRSRRDISDLISDNDDYGGEDDSLMVQMGDEKSITRGASKSTTLSEENDDSNKRRRTDGDSSHTDQDIPRIISSSKNEMERLSSSEHGMQNNVKRCLSSASLVSMLKIQPIGEYNELHDDIRKYNLEETIQIDATLSRASSSDNISELRDEDEDEHENDTNANGTDKEVIENVTHNENVKNSATCGDADTSDKSSPYSGEEKDVMGADIIPVQGFIPFPEPPLLPERVEVANAMMNQTTHSDSSTFFLQSMQSAESITHVSDASGYDYYSISSDEEDTVSEFEEKPKGATATTSGAVGQQSKARGITTPNKQISAAHAPKVVDLGTKKLNKEVCEILGIPKENVRKVHRGIMSHNTELQLRKIKNEVETQLDTVETKSKKDGTSKGTLETKLVPKSELTNQNTATSIPHSEQSQENEAAVHNDDSSSSSDEDCLVFGPSQKKEKDMDKWEKIRLERKTSRESARRVRSSGNSNSTSAFGADNIQRAKTDNKDNSSDHELDQTVDSRQRRSAGVDRQEEPPEKLQMPYLNRYASDESDNSTVVNKVRKRFSNVYQRFSGNTRRSSNSSSGGGYSERDDNSTDYDDDDDDEGEGPSWDKNILTEGEYYLAMSMLVYIYALLRETSLLGHTDISFDEIDVNSHQSNAGGSVSVGSSSPNMDKSAYLMLSKTQTAGFIIRVVMDELEKKGAFSSVEKNEGDMSVLKEFKKWVEDSRRKQLDAATEATIKELKRKVARRRWKRAINAVRLMVRLGRSDSNSFDLQLARRRSSRSSLSNLRESLTGSINKLTNTINIPTRVDGGVRSSMLWMHDQRNQIMSSLGIASASDPTHSQESSQNNLVSEREIKDIINDALEQPRFFIEGSLLSNLIESGIEVVWFGDRHPNDVVYALCVNRQYKRVSVVFRGTVNQHNWIMNMKFAIEEQTNPIQADYHGRDETVGLHTGFALYMTRRRKDDSLTKIEEIISNIDVLGRELAPDGDYELSIAGHSLGGALATILSFYAASNNKFSKVKNIRVFTYAAPRVGCRKFLHAYQYLEKIGKLRHARFTNTSDIVPLIPFHGVSRSYKHVGLNIRLLGVNKYSQYWLRQALDVTYPKNQGFLSQMWRGFKSSLIRNLNTVKGYKRDHTLSEYQRRIRFALDYRSMLAQAGFFHSKKRSRLKTLDEYYFIKGASNVTCTGELTRIALEDRAKERVRREARKVVIFLLLFVLLEGVILAGLSKQVNCENYPIVLYPLLLLTGCRNGRSASECTITRDIREIPTFEQQSSTFEPHETLAQGNKINDTTNMMEETLLSSLLKNTTDASSWTSSLMSWLWGWRKSSWSPYTQPFCVWGHCTSLSRPYRPWGVLIEHKPLPPTIDYWSFD